VSALSIAYCEQRAAVVSHMSLNAIERIRSGKITAGAANVPAFEQAFHDKPDF
jgi:hypothetical protein